MKTQHKNEYEEQKNVRDVRFTADLRLTWNERIIWALDCDFLPMRCVGSFLGVCECICVVQRFGVAAIAAFFFRLRCALAVCMRMKHSTVQYFYFFCLPMFAAFLLFFISFFFSSGFVSVPRSMCVDSLLLLSVGLSYAGVLLQGSAWFFRYHAFDTDSLTQCLWNAIV